MDRAATDRGCYGLGPLRLCDERRGFAEGLNRSGRGRVSAQWCNPVRGLAVETGRGNPEKRL